MYLSKDLSPEAINACVCASGRSLHRSNNL